LVSQVDLCPYHEEGALLVNGEQSGLVNVTAIHRVNGIFCYRHFVKHSNIMHLANGHGHERRNRTAQVN